MYVLPNRYVTVGWFKDLAVVLRQVVKRHRRIKWIVMYYRTEGHRVISLSPHRP